MLALDTSPLPRAARGDAAGDCPGNTIAATALAALPRLAGGVPVPAAVPAATACGAGAGTVSPVGVCLESSHTVAWVGAATRACGRWQGRWQSRWQDRWVPHDDAWHRGWCLRRGPWHPVLHRLAPVGPGTAPPMA